MQLLIFSEHVTPNVRSCKQVDVRGYLFVPAIKTCRVIYKLRC